MISVLLFVTLFFSSDIFSALQSDASIFAAHAGMISQMKSYFLPKLPIDTKNVLLSQTEAQLAHPWIKKTIETCWGSDLIRLKPLIDKILKQEKALAETHYVFYHAQQGDFRVLQDITKELMGRMNLKGFSEFAYLRAPSSSFDKTENLEKFLDATEMRFYPHHWNDHESDLRKKLTSVNISLFGNYDYKNYGECTFEFFLRSSNIADFCKKDLLQAFFIEHDFNPAFIKKILDTYTIIKTTEGNLLQIFIPKNKADACAYVSLWRGTPYKKQVVADCYDITKKRHTKIAPLLDAYKKNPALFDSSVQARLLITSDTFLNPDSDIKIVSYSSASDQALKQYKEKIEQLATQIIAEKISRTRQKKQSKSSPLTKLLAYLEIAQSTV